MPSWLVTRSLDGQVFLPPLNLLDSSVQALIVCWVSLAGDGFDFIHPCVRGTAIRRGSCNTPFHCDLSPLRPVVRQEIARHDRTIADDRLDHGHLVDLF